MTDETKDNLQDGTKGDESKDTSSKSQQGTQEGEKGSTQKETPTFTEEQEKLIDQRVKAELSRRGRDIKSIEAREKAVQEREDAIRETQWEIDVFEIAKESKVEAQTLKDKLAELKITDKETAKKIAELMTGSKITIKTDSGKNVGGTPDYSSLSPKEKIQKGLEEKSKKGA